MQSPSHNLIALPWFDLLSILLPTFKLLVSLKIPYQLDEIHPGNHQHNDRPVHYPSVLPNVLTHHYLLALLCTNQMFPHVLVSKSPQRPQACIAYAPLSHAHVPRSLHMNPMLVYILQVPSNHWQTDPQTHINFNDSHSSSQKWNEMYMSYPVYPRTHMQTYLFNMLSLYYLSDWT